MAFILFISAQPSKEDAITTIIIVTGILIASFYLIAFFLYTETTKKGRGSSTLGLLPFIIGLPIVGWILFGVSYFIVIEKSHSQPLIIVGAIALAWPLLQFIMKSVFGFLIGFACTITFYIIIFVS